MVCFKKSKRILAIVIAFAIILTLYTIKLSTANKNEEPQDKYTITTPYEFPIQPGTDEWKKLKSHTEKVDVCQIPNNILENMTTEALAETVINYPLSADMFAYSSPNKGFQQVYSVFNGLQELASRLDVTDKLKKCKEKSPLIDMQSDTDESAYIEAYIDMLINGIRYVNK